MRKTFYKLAFGFTLYLLSNMPMTLVAQDPRLAREYFSSGEYEKAAEIYKKLHEQDKGQEYYYDRYLATLIELKDYKGAEDMLKKAIKSHPDKLERYIDYGFLYKTLGEDAKSKEQYEKAIKGINSVQTANQSNVTKIANVFINKKEYDYAIAVFEKGEKVLKEKNMYAYELASLYSVKGEHEKSISYFLDALDVNPNRLTNIQAHFQRTMGNDKTGAKIGYAPLKKELLQRIQKDNTNMMYPELLIWVFTQEGEYLSAMRQAKAIDKRLAENGMRVFRLAQLAFNEKEYEAAIDGYSYVSKEKGKESPYFLESKEALLRTKKAYLLSGNTFTQEQLRDLEAEYNAYLTEFGRTRSTVPVMRDLAEFEARYLYNLEKAIALLEEVIKIPQVSRVTLAEVKLELGDYYLMSGDPWEATLLYSQVDKDQKDSPLGEMARFKNAKLSYYKGDFDWAQSQLQIIKGSTSELTSNDAIELSVFIMDHLNLDTSATAMKLFSDADLLRFQNKDQEAIQKMDSIILMFKGHGLEDDVLFVKGDIAFKNRDYKKAAAYYQEIIDNHKEGILIDNSLFKLAELYEHYLDDPKKAMDLYDTIIIDHSASIFVIEARKRFRQLRGDNLP